MDLSGLRQAYGEIEFDRLLAALEDDRQLVVPDLTPVKRRNLSSSERSRVLIGLKSLGKRLVAADRDSKALPVFALAQEIDSHDHLLADRLSLMRKTPDRQGIDWQISLQEMQRQFHTICTKTPCVCRSHLRIARCLGVFGHDEPRVVQYDGATAALTISAYHSWSLATLWSKLVKRIKRDFERPLVPFVGRIAADFIKEETALLRTIDVLVPVPPSPAKYGKRGFAPTVLVAEEISKVLGIPVRIALNRKPGPATREATDDELADQFTLDEGSKKQLRGASVLLVEDVVTTGRSVSVCAAKLQSAHPAGIGAIALAKSTRI